MRTLFLFVLYIVVVLLLVPVILVFQVAGLRDPILSVGRWVMRWSRSILGIRVEVAGADRIDRGGACIFMANHASFLDGPLMILTVPVFIRVILKQGVFRIPIVGWAMSLAGFVPVDRKGENRGRISIEKAADLMRTRGYSFLIFPEGTRSRNGRLQRFRRGGFFLAVATGAPIVPVTISGTYELMPKGKFFVKPGKIHVEFHPPVRVAGTSEKDISGLIDKVRASISSGLDG